MTGGSLEILGEDILVAGGSAGGIGRCYAQFNHISLGSAIASTFNRHL